MKSLQLQQFVKSLDELPTTDSALHHAPTPRNATDIPKGSVLVQVRAVGVNFFDILMVMGKYQHRPKGPFVPGGEFAGVVVLVGQGVTKWRKGDRVFGAVMTGAYASHVVVPNADREMAVSGLLRVPERLSFEQASGISVTYPTSYAALVDRGRLAKGETVLVHAGAGGVGIAAIQVAKALGATVIATASTQHKLDIMQAEGADYVLNYTEMDDVTQAAKAGKSNKQISINEPVKVPAWIRRVMEITKGKGVDVVFDPVGLIDQSMKVAAWNARLVIVGFAGLRPGTSESVTTNRVLLKNISLVGLFWGQFRVHEPHRVDQVWEVLTKWFDEGKLTPVVYKDDGGKDFVGLTSAAAALKCLGSRKSYGKIAVQVPPEDADKSKL
ncbi:hypothetical protein RI367_004755 [Sorochytrium milnesiophthora]